MGQGKRAWIYCAIDAPEDRNGALKSQFKQLIDYGEQMGFELVGSSSDVGTTPLWNRNDPPSTAHAHRRSPDPPVLPVPRFPAPSGKILPAPCS